MSATLTTEAAVRAILSLIHSDIVDLTDFEDVGAKLDELSDVASLSTGESVLVDVAWSVWRGGWGAHIGDLGQLDAANVDAVLGILRGRYVGMQS